MGYDNLKSEKYEHYYSESAMEIDRTYSSIADKCGQKNSHGWEEDEKLMTRKPSYGWKNKKASNENENI